MRHPAIAALYRYWQDKCGGRTTPRRVDIEPGAISSELRDVFILDGMDPDLPFRLAGSRVVETLGRTLTGVAFRALWTRHDMQTVEYALDCVSRDGMPILIGIRLLPDEEDGASTRPSENSSDNIRSSGFSGAWHGACRDNRDAGLSQKNMQKEEDGSRMRSHGNVSCSNSAEMLLLPLLHQGRPGGRILGGFVRLGAPCASPECRMVLNALGTRVLKAGKRPDTAHGLIHGDVARTVISRHGHLLLIQGFKDQPPS